MSTVKEAAVTEGNFLRNVELTNYKSIKALEVNFKHGLNIIIGKNSSGKTNFINGLDNVLSFKYKAQPDTDSQIKVFINNSKIVVKTTINNEEALLESPHLLQPSHQLSLLVNDRKVVISDSDDLRSGLLDDGYLWDNKIITYKNPYIESFFIEKPIFFNLINNGKRSRGGVSEYGYTHFTAFFFFRLLNTPLLDGLSSPSDHSGGRLADNLIHQTDYILSQLNDNLNIYSPINSVRVNRDFKVITEDNGQKISINNFCLEFNIDGKWLPFGFLSDGTKRLFYIISECTNYLPPSVTINTDESLEIVLLEEPELGIHPHQLHQLMLFIKEQSREKQIILTTHSPQVLDILGPDELDRIIICDYSSDKGTQLHHLTDAQIKKAKLYMENEGFLSDYWRFSDLEPA